MPPVRHHLLISTLTPLLGLKMNADIERIINYDYGHVATRSWQVFVKALLLIHRAYNFVKFK